MQIVRGLGYIISGGQAVGIQNSAFYTLGSAAFLGLPVPVWITIACFILFGFILNSTVFGRNTLAIGGNEEASRLAGINVDRTKIIIFVLQGLMAASAGIILASRMTSGQPMTSQGFALEVISACVLGGVSLTGGIGTMTGVIVGVMIMGTVQNAMNLMNIPSFYQYVARGVILLGAVLFDRLKQGNRK
jgi:L-arabinose transport system permease protein